MRTVRAQLGDWVTCPSAKTPAGKAKIAQLSARLVTIKSEIKQSDSPSSSAPASRPAQAALPPEPTSRSSSGPLGTRVDTYA